MSRTASTKDEAFGLNALSAVGLGKARCQRPAWCGNPNKIRGHSTAHAFPGRAVGWILGAMDAYHSHGGLREAVQAGSRLYLTSTVPNPATLTSRTLRLGSRGRPSCHPSTQRRTRCSPLGRGNAPSHLSPPLPAHRSLLDCSVAEIGACRKHAGGAQQASSPS